MRAGWQLKSLSEIATHSLGKMLDKAKNKGDPKPYLRNFNVRWFDFDLSDVQEMRFLWGIGDNGNPVVRNFLQNIRSSQMIILIAAHKCGRSRGP